MPNEKTDFNQREYIKAYNREHMVYRKMNLNLGNPEDVELIEWIDSQTESTSAYFKRLVREDMNKRKSV